MQIFVRAPAGEQRILDVSGEETVASVMQMVGCEESYMTLCGSPLSEESTLAECGVNELATLEMNARVLGGKVHGSLARAGKVKSQTPKVEAQEKKKKKTGRCKRRIQYNRRFVNVVTGFGKKKSPNANQS